MSDTLAGQVGLVTGAGRGIGRTIALTLAEHGATVVLGSRTVGQVEAVADEVRRRGGEALAVGLDVTQPQSARAFAEAAVERFGRIDLLVNNAGSNNGADGAIGPMWEIDADAWWHDIEVNFRGAFLCSRAVLPSMVAAGRGRIVNVVSRAAAMAWPFDSAYACAKAATMRLTDSLAGETREHGIYVFCLNPGSVETGIWSTSVNSEAGRRWLPDYEPVWVPPERAAHSVVQLASGVADGLTGRYMSIEDDLAELATRADDIRSRDVLQLRLVT